MAKDWGYNYLYLCQMDTTTRVNLKNHGYRDVTRTPIEDFNSTIVTELGIPTWLGQPKELWMCGDSQCRSLKCEECILERAIEDTKYIPEPFPEEALEPLEWQQILATLDVCAINAGPTMQFCDQDGYDMVPYYMVKAVNDNNEAENDERKTKKDDNKSFYDSLEQLDPNNDADNELSEGSSGVEETFADIKFYDFPNQKPRGQRHYKNKRTLNETQENPRFCIEREEIPNWISGYRLNKYVMPLTKDILQNIHEEKQRAKEKI